MKTGRVISILTLAFVLGLWWIGSEPLARSIGNFYHTLTTCATQGCK